MKPFRFNATALQNVGPGAFQSHYEAQIVGRDLKDPDILTPELLTNLRGTVRVGDEVVICNYSSENRDRLIQFVRIRVVSVDKSGIHIVNDGDIVEIPFRAEEKTPEKPETKAFVRKQFGGGFNVFDRDDKLLESFKTQTEAKEYAERVTAGGM